MAKMNENHKPINPRTPTNPKHKKHENCTEKHHNQGAQNYYKILKAAKVGGEKTSYVKIN